MLPVRTPLSPIQPFHWAQAPHLLLKGLNSRESLQPILLTNRCISLRAAEQRCQQVLSSDASTRKEIIEALLLRGRAFEVRGKFRLAVKGMIWHSGFRRELEYLTKFWTRRLGGSTSLRRIKRDCTEPSRTGRDYSYGRSNSAEV